MAPRVILIRHGQALHNVTNNLRDPALTEEGVLQCQKLALKFYDSHLFSKDNTLIVVSPMRRTLQTFHHGLGRLVALGVPVELRADWQETTSYPCDTGTELDVLQKEWPALDFSGVDPLYPAKTGLYDPSEDSLSERARLVRQWLFNRPEKYVIVVTHSGFLTRVVRGTKFENVEHRIYDFVAQDESSQEFELREVEGDN